MKPTLQIGDIHIPCEQVFQHLYDSHLLPQLLREMAIEELVDRVAQEHQIDLTPTPAEFDRLAAQVASIGPFQGMNPDQIAAISTRTLKLHKFKQAGWGHQVSDYFQTVQNKLHRVVYSILQVEDGSLAQELFFRIQSGEQSFAQIAIQYSQAESAKSGGVVGPVSAQEIPSAIVQTLNKLAPGQLSPLFKLDHYYGFIRLDRWLPPTLDENTHQVLLDELFDHWIKDRIKIEVGENGAILLEQQPMIGIAPANSIPLVATSAAINFDPDFSDRETPISASLESGLLPPTTSAVTVVTEPPDPDLAVSTEFFFPNQQSAPPTAQTLATSSSAQSEVVPESASEPIDPHSKIDPLIQSRLRSRQLILILGLISLIALVGIGVNYYASQSQPPTQPSSESSP